MTGTSISVLIVDKFGRRKLLILSELFISFAFCMLGSFFYVQVFIIDYYYCYYYYVLLYLTTMSNFCKYKNIIHHYQNIVILSMIKSNGMVLK